MNKILITLAFFLYIYFNIKFKLLKNICYIHYSNFNFLYNLNQIIENAKNFSIFNHSFTNPIYRSFLMPRGISLNQLNMHQMLRQTSCKTI